MISVIIVSRNSENYIEGCIQSLIKQFQSSSEWELIIVDGMSSDKTKEKAISLLLETDVNYKLVDNQKHTLATGWNIGLSLAKGVYVVRPDAHSLLMDNYIKNGVLHLKQDFSLAGVGGTLLTTSESFIGSIIAAVLSNPVGVGSTLFRIGVSKDTYTKTVVYAVYKTEVCREVGGFDETLTRNQDIDFNQRIIEKGYKLMTACDMKAIYYNRSSISKFLKQGWQNGFWIINGNTRHINHLMPMFFCFLLIFVGILGVKYLCVLLACYFLISLLSFLIFSKLFHILKLISAVILTFFLHISYGCGSLYGVVKRFLII